MKLADPYGWMRDESREKEEVLEHLKEENKYMDEVTSHLAPLRSKLYDEMLAHLQETDFTAPKKWGDWLYYSRTYKGKSYKVHYRAPSSSLGSGPVQWDGEAASAVLPGETLLLDENVLGEGKPYCAVGALKPDPSQRLLAYTLDNKGGETYSIFIKDIESGEVVDELVGEIDSRVLWGSNDKTIFYEKMDDTHRPYQLCMHKVGTPQDTDVVLFEEKDLQFWLSSWKSQDGNFLLISSGSKETSEINYIDLREETVQVKCVAKRRPKTLYEVEHRNGMFYIWTNHGGLPNMKLMSCKAAPNCEGEWRELTAPDGEALFPGDDSSHRVLEDVLPLKGHLVVYGRDIQEGLPQVWVVKMKDDDVEGLQRMQFDEEAYDVSGGANLEFDVDEVAVSYNSLVSPTQTLKVSLDNLDDRRLIKKSVVPNYDASKYACARFKVRSRDGKTDIPVSMVWNKELRKPEGEPQHLHLYGYGSYGYSMECSFGSSRLPLLDRGIVYVIAHVRGGGEMGRAWYEEPNGAKYLCKKNTFNDFVDVARHLQNKGMTSPDLMSTEGRSAGGLLVGAAVNQAPELFRAAIFGVPFVDVMSTMVDASIPLTVAEWEEWGNPNAKKYMEYIKSYSPVDNVKQGAKYPAILMTGGLHDPRVQFWEPSKMVAQVRHQAAKESGPILLKIDMAAGHFSASDRYKYYRELAIDWAFVLDQTNNNK